AGDGPAVAGEQIALERLERLRIEDLELDGVSHRSADLALDVVLLAFLVRVVPGLANVAILGDLVQVQRSRAPAIVVELVDADEVARLERRADRWSRRALRIGFGEVLGHEEQFRLADRLDG